MFEIRYLLKNKCNREISDRDLQDFLAFNGVTGGKLSEGLINFEDILRQQKADEILGYKTKGHRRGGV